MAMRQDHFIEALRSIMDSAIEEGWSLEQVVDYARGAVLEWEEDMEKIDEPIQPHRKG